MLNKKLRIDNIPVAKLVDKVQEILNALDHLINIEGSVINGIQY